MKNKPLVSILIASHNKEKYVKRCINSCLNQTYKNIEIIFVDDGSKDKSYQIAKQFKNIRVFKKKRVKLKKSFNTFFQIDTYLYAFNKSKGKILSLLDSDDFYTKNKIASIVKFFDKKRMSNIVFNKPIVYHSKDRFFLDSKFKNRRNMWPKFPPCSCISVKRNFFKGICNEITLKKYPLLTLDFRLAVISKLVFNDFKILNKYLTYYFQDPKGESSKFKKFSKNWWSRRLEAHEYFNYIIRKNKVKKLSKVNVRKLDYVITKFLNNFF